MQVAVRSHLIAGVAMLGAGAVAVAPLAPTHVAALPTRTIAVENTAMVVQPLNPFDAFLPVYKAAVSDVYAAIQLDISNPLPILRTVLANQADYAFRTGAALGYAGFTLGSGAFALPGQLAIATKQAVDGDVQGAIDTIQKATLGPVSEASKGITDTAQKILNEQLTIARNLTTAVPQASQLILAATVDAVQTIVRAALVAGQDLVDAVKTARPVQIWNTAVQGAADVALVTEQVTIGYGVPATWEEEAIEEVPVAKSNIQLKTPPSIRLGIQTGRKLIDEALRGSKLETVAAAANASESSAEKGGSAAKSEVSGGGSHAQSTGGSKRAKHSAD